MRRVDLKAAEHRCCAGMGYLGAALATSLLYLMRTAVLLLYMQYTGVCPPLPAQTTAFVMHST